MPSQKYPKEYTEVNIGSIKDPFKPEFRYDTRGRLVMPLPGYSKMMLSTEPGSKTIGQGSEGPAGGGQALVESLQTGYLTAEVAIKCGPKGGWVVALQGGDADYPIQYGNEETGELNFYVDKEGNVVMKGTIEAIAGIIGGWTVTADELYGGSGVNRVGLKSGSWPFYAGAEDPTLAPFRVNTVGAIWCSALTILGGTGVANLDDAGSLALLDQANLDTDVVEGTTFKRTKAMAIDVDGMVLLDKTIEGDYGLVKLTSIQAGEILLSQTVQNVDFRTVTDVEKALWDSAEGSIYKGDTAPSSPDTNDLWINTSVTPNILMRWTGSAWLQCSVENLDDLEEGTTYKRTKSVAISPSGLVLLDETEIGSVYSLVAKTDIQSGHIKLDTVIEGTYSLVATTDIQSGHIKLDTVIEGTNGLVLSTSIDSGKILVTGGAGVKGILPVGYSEAKCTDPFADETANNAQSYSWITGSKPPIDADHTANIVGSLAYYNLVKTAMESETLIVGGYIATTLLTATNIVTGTLTGRTVRSAGSGNNRIELCNNAFGDEKTIYWVQGSPEIARAYIQWNYSLDLLLIGATGDIQLYTQGDIECQGNIMPSGSGFDMGSTTKPWDNLYISDIYYGTRWLMDFKASSSIQVRNVDFIPGSDNGQTCGRWNQRWSDLRSVLIKGDDYGFENNWYLTEHDRVGIEEKGIAILDSKNELKLFIGESGIYVKGGNVKNLDILPYVKTTIEQRVRMDNHPELMIRDKEQEGLELPNSKDAGIGGVKYIEKKIMLKKNIESQKKNIEK